MFVDRFGFGVLFVVVEPRAVTHVKFSKSCFQVTPEKAIEQSSKAREKPTGIKGLSLHRTSDGGDPSAFLS